jgi:hypothetical protein
MTTATHPSVSADLRTPRAKVRDFATDRERALSRAARLAHRDTGHIGPLALCGEELCRALADAGAE